MDRSIARRDWSTLYPNAIEEHGSFTCSDHRPIIVSSDIVIPKHKAFPFRFLNFWHKYHQVDTIIRKAWRSNARGTNMFKFVQKLKRIKNEVKTWAKTHFGNFQEKLKKNTQTIEYVEEQLIQNPASLRLNSWLLRLLKQREKMILFNQKYWGKLQRKEWLINGDRNTTFFQ